MDFALRVNGRNPFSRIELRSDLGQSVRSNKKDKHLVTSNLLAPQSMKASGNKPRSYALEPVLCKQKSLGDVADHG